MNLPKSMQASFEDWYDYFLNHPSSRGGAEDAALLEMLEQRARDLVLNLDEGNVSAARSLVSEIVVLLAVRSVGLD